MTRMTNIPHNYLSNTIKCLSLSLSLASSLSLPPIMLHLRQGLVSGYQADPLHQLNITNAHLGRFNRFEFGILAPANTKNYSNFGDLGVIEFSSPTPRNRRWCSDSGSSSVIEFSTMSSLEDESDVSSPPLWKTSLPATPTTMASVLHLSPTAQSQEIARGHRELMEMIRNMPESAYDLSLKDIVELSTAGGEKRGSTSEAIQKGKIKRSIINNNSKRHGLRNGNTNHRDFLLKMFLPSALGPKKRSSNNATCSKVSPKPQQMEGEKIGLEKSLDTEWWKKRLSSARESVNSRTSRSSSCSNGRSSSRRYLYILSS